MTSKQGDLLLDVLEQTRVVRLAWEQCETHARNGQTAFQKAERKKVQEATQKTYDKALEELVDLYIKANEAGVSDDDLIKVLKGRLPQHITLKLDTA